MKTGYEIEMNFPTQNCGDDKNKSTKFTIPNPLNTYAYTIK